MIDLTKHKEWCMKVINSCATPEQIDSARILISLFVVNMSKIGVPIADIRKIEDELLEIFLSKETTITIF